MKKILIRISEIICVLIIVFSIFLLMTVVFNRSGQQPSFFGYSTFRVLTGSMEPNIPTDSFVIVKKTDPANVQPQDVISFYSRDPSLRGAVNTHRVLEKEQNENGVWVFTTKGDANILQDQYFVYGSDIIGVVVYHSTAIGKFVRLVSNPLIFGLLVLVPLILIFVANIKSMWNTAKAVAELEMKQIEEDCRELEDDK